MKKILTIFLCLCFVQMHIVSAKMQDKIYLTGNVLDKNKQPIESAYIEIKYSDNKLMGYSLSDSLGFFSIPIENCKKFFIQINHISYHMYEKEYSLTSSLRNLVFMLEEKTNEMSEIVITANSRKSLKLVDGALLFTPTVLGNISTYNLSGLLKKLPSMQISSSGLSMNGRTVSLYINGRKKELLGQSIQAFLNSVPADRIKEISIYPGATGEDVATEMGRVDVILKNTNLSGCRIKVPHHGSKHNLTSDLIDKLAPSCAIISAKGTQKHPSRGVVHCLSYHCNVYSTHKSGNLVHTSSAVNKPAIPLKEKQS